MKGKTTVKQDSNIVHGCSPAVSSRKCWQTTRYYNLLLDSHPRVLILHIFLIIMAAAPMSKEVDQSEAVDVPLFDLSQFHEESPDLKELYVKFRQACEEWGCFQVINYQIRQDVLQNANSIIGDLFALPVETKRKNVSPLRFHGYVGPSSGAPFYESLGINGAPDPEAIRQFSDTMWPHGNQKFCEIIEEYCCGMKELVNSIYKIVHSSLGTSNYCASHFDKCKTILRMNQYSVCERPSESIAFAAHTDGNYLTILQDGCMGGLQVLNRQGEWVNVNPRPNSLVVLIGDTLQAWSNGRIRSARHRVIAEGWKSRLSLGFFSSFPQEMEVSAPPELIDEDHPRRYKRFIFSDYMDFRYEIGRTLQTQLESFAGISSHD